MEADDEVSVWKYDFDTAIFDLFIFSKIEIAVEHNDERTSNIEKGFILMDLLNTSMEYKYQISTSAMFYAFVRMRNLCALANNRRLFLRKPIVREEISDAENKFVLLALTNDVNCPSAVDNEREIENKVVALFKSIIATIERTTGKMRVVRETAIDEERMIVNAVVNYPGFYTSNKTFPNMKFKMAVFALELFVGYLAACSLEANTNTDEYKTSDARRNVFCIKAKAGTKMHITSDTLLIKLNFSAPERKLWYSKSLPDKTGKSSKPFHYDLYLYIAYKYNIIPEKYYTSFRSKTMKHHFTENIGKSVILLSFAYSEKLSMFFRDTGGRALNTHFDYVPFTSNLVEDSVRKHSDSSYRYLALLSFISDLLFISYVPFIEPDHEKDSFEWFFDRASEMYEKSGMEKFGELISSDNFKSLKEHADRIAAAWEKMESTVISFQKGRYYAEERLKELNIDEIDLEGPSVQHSGGAGGKPGLDVIPSGNATTEVNNKLGSDRIAVGEEEPEDVKGKTEIQSGCKPKTVKKKGKKNKGKK